MEETLKEFILEHENDDTGKLLLSRDRWPSIPVDLAVNTIEARKKFRTKLPSWYRNPDLIYPSRLSAEQCSSEETALYKAAIAEKLLREVFRSGRKDAGHSLIADLTGGLGVDSWAFSAKADKVLYNEMNSELASHVCKNFRKLGIKNVMFTNFEICPEDELDGKDGVSSINGLLQGQKAGIIYLDPARRNREGKKVFLLEDCSPDIVRLKDELTRSAEFVMVKLSPMADIAMVAGQLGCCREFHVVSSGGECKEVIAVLQEGWDQGYCMHCHESGNTFSFTYEEEKKSVPYYLENIDDAGNFPYLFEPGKSLSKAGAFNLVSERFGMVKAGRSTHLYLADRTAAVTASPYGKTFRIIEIHPMNNRTMKDLGKRFPKSEVTARNLPLGSDALRKKICASSGDDAHIFGLRFDTGGKSENMLLVCRPESLSSSDT